MKIRHSIPVIDNPLKPFGNCKLDREKYGNTLTSMVSTYADGFVMAINNEWGTGKTTFVKMWQQSLINNGFSTLYFNAWEHDFDHDPVVAVLSELKSLTRKEDTAFNSLMDKAGALSKHLIPVLVKALADKYIDTKGIGEAFEKLSEGAIDIMKGEIKEYSQKKETLQAFKTELEEYVREQCGGKPLVFIIDELDRCRPNYAVEVLEKVKHFFSVPGIVFVLSIDKVQLGHAIKGVYGSAELDSDEYLRRFIDLEFKLPRPNTERYCYYLFEYFKFEKFFNDHKDAARLRLQHGEFIMLASELFQNGRLTLRQQERIFAHARASLNGTFEMYSFFPVIFLILIYLRILKPELYRKIKIKSLKYQEFIDEMFKILSVNTTNNQHLNLIHIEAELVHLYHRSFENPTEGLLTESGNKITLHVKPRFDNSPSFSSFSGYIQNPFRGFSSKTLNTDFFLNKIDVLEDI